MVNPIAFAELFGEIVSTTQNRTDMTKTEPSGDVGTKVTAAAASSKRLDSRTVKESKSSSSKDKSKSSPSKEKSKSSSSKNKSESSSSSAKDKSSTKSLSSSEHRHHSRDEKKKDMSKEREKLQSSLTKENGKDKQSSNKEKKRGESHNHNSASSELKEGSKYFGKEEDSHKKISRGDRKDKKDDRDKHQGHQHGDKSEGKKDPSKQVENKYEKSSKEKELESLSRKINSSFSESGKHSSKKSSHAEKPLKEVAKPSSNDVAAFTPTSSKPCSDQQYKQKDNKCETSKLKEHDLNNVSIHKKDSSHSHHDKDKSTTSTSGNGKKDSKSSSSSSKNKSSDVVSGRYMSGKGSPSSRVFLPACVSTALIVQAPTSPPTAHPSSVLHPSVPTTLNSSSVSPHHHFSSMSPSSSHVSSGSLSLSPSSVRNDSSASHHHRHKSSKSSKERTLSPNRSFTKRGGGGREGSHHSMPDSLSPAPKRAPAYYHRQLQVQPQQISLTVAPVESNSRASATSLYSASPISHCSIARPSAQVAVAVIEPAASLRVDSSKKAVSSKMVAEDLFLQSSSPRTTFSPRVTSLVTEDPQAPSSQPDMKRKRTSCEDSVASLPPVSQAPAVPHSAAAPFPCLQKEPDVRISKKKRQSRSTSSSSFNSSMLRSSSSSSSSISRSRSRSKPESVSRSRSRSSSSAGIRSSSRNGRSMSRSVSRSPSPPSKSPRSRSRLVSRLNRLLPSPHRLSSATNSSPVPRHNTLAKLLDECPSSRDSENLDLTAQPSSKRRKTEPRKEFKKESTEKRVTMLVNIESRVKSDICYIQKVASNKEISRSTSLSPVANYSACIENAIRDGMTSISTAAATKSKVLSPNKTGNKFNPSLGDDKASERQDTANKGAVETYLQNATVNDNGDSDDSDECNDDDSDDDNSDSSPSSSSSSSSSSSESTMTENDDSDSSDAAFDDNDDDEEEEAVDSRTEPFVTPAEGIRAEEGNILRRVGRGMSKEEEERLFQEGSEYVRTVYEEDGSMRQENFPDWFANDGRVYYFIKRYQYPMSLAVEVNTACRRLAAAEDTDVLVAVYNCVTKNNVKLNGRKILWNKVDVDVLKSVKNVLRVHNAHLLEIDLS